MTKEIEFMKIIVESEDGSIKTSFDISKNLVAGLKEMIAEFEKEDGVDAIGLNEILALGFIALSGDGNGN